MDKFGNNVINAIDVAPKVMAKGFEEFGNGAKDFFTGKMFGLSEIEGI